MVEAAHIVTQTSQDDFELFRSFSARVKIHRVLVQGCFFRGGGGGGYHHHMVSLLLASSLTSAFQSAPTYTFQQAGWGTVKVVENGVQTIYTNGVDTLPSWFSCTEGSTFVKLQVIATASIAHPTTNVLEQNFSALPTARFKVILSGLGQNQSPPQSLWISGTVVHGNDLGCVIYPPYGSASDASSFTSKLRKSGGVRSGTNIEDPTTLEDSTHQSYRFKWNPTLSWVQVGSNYESYVTIPALLAASAKVSGSPSGYITVASALGSASEKFFPVSASENMSNIVTLTTYPWIASLEVIPSNTGSRGFYIPGVPGTQISISLSEYSSGSQNIKLRIPNALSKIVSVNLGSSTFDLGNMDFKLGDINNDNSISSVEYQFILDRMGISSIDSDWNTYFELGDRFFKGRSADINHDGDVNILDANIVQPYVGQSGE